MKKVLCWLVVISVIASYTLMGMGTVSTTTHLPK